MLLKVITIFFLNNLLLGIVKSLTGQGNITEGDHQKSDGHVIEGDDQTLKVSAVSLMVVTPPRRDNDVLLV